MCGSGDRQQESEQILRNIQRIFTEYPENIHRISTEYCAYGEVHHNEQTTQHQCKHRLQNSLRRGALQVELLKMNLYSLVGKSPEVCILFNWEGSKKYFQRHVP